MAFGRVDVDAQDLAQQRVEILPVADLGSLALVVAIPAVTDPDVQVAIRAESHPTAVVVGVGLVDLQTHLLRGRIEGEGLRRRRGELGDAQRAVPVGRRGFASGRRVRDHHPTVLLELGMQGQTQDTAFIEGALVEGRQPVGERQDRGLTQLARFLKEPDEPRLIDDECPPIGQGDVGERRGQSSGHPGQGNRGGGLKAPHSEEGHSKGDGSKRHGAER